VSTLLRILFLIPLGYVLAVIAAATTAALAEWLRAYGPVADDPAALGMTGMVVLMDWFILMIFLGAAAAIPSLVAVGAAEVFGIRSALYFCGAGLAVAFVTSLAIDPAGIPPFMAEPAIAGASGLAAGLVYWLVAGQWSGLVAPEPKQS
jgi:hypothetical protein